LFRKYSSLARKCVYGTAPQWPVILHILHKSLFSVLDEISCNMYSTIKHIPEKSIWMHLIMLRAKKNIFTIAFRWNRYSVVVDGWNSAHGIQKFRSIKYILTKRLPPLPFRIGWHEYFYRSRSFTSAVLQTISLLGRSTRR